MKRKKGFTLVELLAVIVLISLLLIITISSVQNVSKNSKSKLCRTKLSTIEDAVNLYLATNPECFKYNSEDNFIDDSIDDPTSNEKKLNCSDLICSSIIEEDNNNICITTVENLVKLGIVENDNNDNNDIKVINHYNKQDMKDKKVSISHNDDSNIFITNFLKQLSENDENDKYIIVDNNKYIIDDNYKDTCGNVNSNGISEDKQDPSFFDYYENYFVRLKIENKSEEDDFEYIGIGYKDIIYKSKIGTSCQQFLLQYELDEGNKYQFDYYAIDDDNKMLTCYFKEKEKPSIHILYDTKAIKITNGIKDEDTYEPNPDEPIEIKYDFISEEYRLDNISCSPNVCDIDKDNKTIKVNLKYDKVIVNIETDNKYVLNYYIDDANGADDNYLLYDSSKDTILNDSITNGKPVNSAEEAKQICEKNMDTNLFTSSSIDKEYGKKAYRCKYNRKGFKINLSKDTNISQSIINNEDIKQEYKWGQTIKVRFKYKDKKYYFGYIDENNTTKNIAFNIPTDILTNKDHYDNPNEDIITFTMPAQDIKLSVKSGEVFNMTLYNHFQDANNEDGYDAYKVGVNPIFIVISNNDYLNYIYSFCGKKGYTIEEFDYENYILASNYNYFSKSSSEINCYYDRKPVNVSVKKESDAINSKIIITPNNAQISENKTIEYRYGESIMYKLVSDLTDIKTNIQIEHNSKTYDCQNYKGCTINNNGTYELQVTEDIKLIPEIKESFKIYKYYQNADNKDGYDLKLIGDTGEINSADSSKLELEKLCQNTDSNYAYDGTISYIVRTNHEVNCYYNRKSVNITFDKSNEKLKQYSIVPHTKDDLSNYTITNNETFTYRYGQSIILTKYVVEDNYSIDKVKCLDKDKNAITNSEICNVASTGETKIKAKQDMTIDLSIKDKEEMYDIYFYYQNADNKDGYNNEKKESKSITLKDDDSTKFSKACSSSDSAYIFNESLSYIVNDAHEIKCYYDRKTVTLTYNIDSNIISSFGYIPANNKTISIGTDNNTVEYRYGQNIILKINKYAKEYTFDCNGLGTCICANDVIKINITGDLTVTVKEKESE